MRYILLIFSIILTNSPIFSQNIDTTINISTINVSGERIELPFNSASHSIEIINNESIRKTAAQNVADLLQNVAGIDIKRRGLQGSQADISMRGGSFDQVLILIDGLKMNDAQTGHHNMNLPIELNNIERIEIIKGPTARIYGLNAFSGAINIITKKITKETANFNLSLGSFGTTNVGFGFTTGKKWKQSIQFSKVNSNGHVYNTDLDNQFLTYTSQWGKTNNYKLIATFSERKFGANGFYASPLFKDQYEETRTGLVGLQSRYVLNKLIIKPRIYWRRNRDIYLFLRDNPSYYMNVHTTNKYVGEINANYTSKLGITGIGMSYNHTTIESNNLGNHKRNTSQFNLEHRIYLKNLNLDITPGVSVTNVSDINTFILPGMDVGFSLNDQIRMYANWGQTSRIPTYTDLYYVGPTTQGNSQLKTEVATTTEGGIKYSSNGFITNITIFKRDAKNLIDWTKDNEVDKWEARNFNRIISIGVETKIGYSFPKSKIIEDLSINYLYMDSKLDDLDVPYSRYIFNNLKHQVTGLVSFRFGKNITTSFNYKYLDRVNYKDYTILDGKLGIEFKKIDINIYIYNLLNTDYHETNLVKMPGRNLSTSIVLKL